MSKDEKKHEEAKPGELDVLKKQVADYRDSLQHLQADFENYRKRVEKDNAALSLRAKADIMKALLPVVDSFELALKNNADPEKFRKGTEMIYAQLYSTLEDIGLKKIDALNQKFDPYKHEVLLQEPSEKDGIVLEELQRGYLLAGNILRYTKVKVGKKEEKDGSK